MRLIDADALKKTFKNKGEALFKLSRVRDIINKAPTVTPSLNLDNITEADVEKFKMIWQRATSKGLLVISEDRPHGEWIVDKRTREVVCSCCGQSRRDTRTTHVYFCNHCGAEMQKGGSET